MLKIHSFLQRVKEPIDKAMPKCIGGTKTKIAVIAYAMIMVLFLLNPDFINGKGEKETNSLAEANQNLAANNTAGETANEVVARIDSIYLSNQFMYNEVGIYSNKDVDFIPLQTKFLTNETKSINDKITEKNDSIKDETNTSQANVNVDIKVDSGSTMEKLKESTESVSSTDKQTNGTKVKSKEEKEKSSNSDTKTNQKSDKKKKQSDEKKSNAIGLNNKETEVLQRIVEAEASGESTKGKMLVANVILNRIKNKSFPSTVEGVVFQRTGGTYQFSPIKDGRYYSIKVSSDTKEAVRRVLKGEDESKGALYFSARSKADKNSMSWFDRHLTFLFKYGGHEFFK